MEFKKTKFYAVLRGIMQSETIKFSISVLKGIFILITFYFVSFYLIVDIESIFNCLLTESVKDWLKGYNIHGRDIYYLPTAAAYAIYSLCVFSILIYYYRYQEECKL
jgi:hypothetical protein